MNVSFKAVSLVLGMFLLGTPLGLNDTVGAKATDKTANKSLISKVKQAVKKNKNRISVPGYAEIDLIADQKEQSTNLRNPIQNDCYFKISIVLEDGTLIWKSDFMAPGEKADNIKLLKALPEGTYENVTVKYDCFSMSKKASLNNARIKLKLVVKKKQ